MLTCLAILALGSQQPIGLRSLPSPLITILRKRGFKVENPSELRDGWRLTKGKIEIRTTMPSVREVAEKSFIHISALNMTTRLLLRPTQIELWKQKRQPETTADIEILRPGTVKLQNRLPFLAGANLVQIGTEIDRFWHLTESFRTEFYEYHPQESTGFDTQMMDRIVLRFLETNTFWLGNPKPGVSELEIRSLDWELFQELLSLAGVRKVLTNQVPYRNSIALATLDGQQVIFFLGAKKSSWNWIELGVGVGWVLRDDETALDWIKGSAPRHKFANFYANHGSLYAVKTFDLRNGIKLNALEQGITDFVKAASQLEPRLPLDPSHFRITPDAFARAVMDSGNANEAIFNGRRSG